MALAKGMTCRQVDGHLISYLEEQITDLLRSKIDEHLERCSDCRKELENLRSVVSTLKDVVHNTPPYRPSPEFNERLNRTIQQEIYTHPFEFRLGGKTFSRSVAAMKTAQIAFALIVVIAMIVVISHNQNEKRKQAIAAKSLNEHLQNHEFWIKVNKNPADESKAFVAGFATLKGLKAKLRVREFDFGPLYYCKETVFSEQSCILYSQTMRLDFEKVTSPGVYTAELEITRGNEKIVIPCKESIEVK